MDNSFQTPPSILDDSLHYTVSFIESYGWPILISIIALYCAKDYINDFFQKLSLKNANNPSRRKLLDEERKRARVNQQLDIFKSTREAENKGKKNKTNNSIYRGNDNDSNV
jgi:hypothetical protein